LVDAKNLNGRKRAANCSVGAAAILCTKTLFVLEYSQIDIAGRSSRGLKSVCGNSIFNGDIPVGIEGMQGLLTPA
jgi:hypothetical protein